jgi:hypothetical protein
MSLYTVYRRNCSYRRCTKTFIVHVAVNTNPTITTTTVPPIDVYKDIHCTCCCKYKPYNYDYNSSSYRRCTMTFIVHVVVNTNPTITTTRRNCCSRNRRVCIYNNMYNECLCTPSIGGTVVVVIVGFVFTTTCTVVNTNPTITTTTVPPIDDVQRHSLYMLL